MTNLTRAQPVRWLHIPKCGQSFILPLVLFACDQRRVPVDEVYSVLHRKQENDQNHHKVLQVASKFGMYRLNNCPRLLRPVRIAHEGVRPEEVRRVVGLLRHPWRRVLSKWKGAMMSYASHGRR